ncbi:MAG: DUF4234 domain-containing protein [Candidatus Heimdallarchaeota archaeon]|nr:DUF4234 domain-containing protein [Candidatus Heimdallarchaeota archaeon]MBY8993394.1 DUF4234 domain-containing protein [Candidatus Heimdallarchaeota archaeon]
MPQQYKFGTTRRYRRVLIFSLLTFGIYYLFYTYWLFKDLDDHYNKVLDFELEAYPTKNSPTTMIIFLFLLPVYPVYVKYHLLHEHIATSKTRSKANCPEGYKAMLVFIFLTFLTIGIVPLIIESRWQKAFNSHIIAHERRAKFRKKES